MIKEKEKKKKENTVIISLNIFLNYTPLTFFSVYYLTDHLAAAAAKSLQSCPALCDPIDGSPPGSPVPGTLQARILEWVAISFSNAWKWSRSVESDSVRPRGLQPTRIPRPWDSPGKSTGVGCHCLLHRSHYLNSIKLFFKSFFSLSLCFIFPRFYWYGWKFTDLFFCPL